MKLTGDRGLSSPQWTVHELLTVEDINSLHQTVYENMTDILALLSTQEAANEVIRGFELAFNAGLDVDVAPGAAVSFDGNYFTDTTFGFAASAGSVFSVVNPITNSITFDTGVGMSNPRIDTVEIRPKQTTYRSENRPFKDPVTTLVGAISVPTRIEYTCEIQILKGTEAASPVAPASTAGWIKIGEVSIAVGQSVLTQGDIADYRDSGSWTTEASSTVETTQRGVGSGTSFPGSPTFGDEFYRTDIDKWFKFNGTIWMEI